MDPDMADLTLDVRKIDGPPFDDIMGALDELGPDDVFLLIAGFEPEPLYSVLEQRGFRYDSEAIDPDIWHVRIEPT